jgi:hypothetical protein
MKMSKGIGKAIINIEGEENEENRRPEQYIK